MARTWLQDAIFGLRGLRRNPRFSALALTVLALGIGVVSAMFGVVNAVLLRPLPYPDPDRLMRVWGGHAELASLSLPEFLDLSEQSRVFESIGAYRGEGGVIRLPGGEAQRILSESVTGQFFQTLGVAPLHGRFILPRDDRPGIRPAMVLSHNFWRRHAGGSPDVVGETLRFGAEEHTVAGVMPPGFAYSHDAVDAWVSEGVDPSDPGGRGERSFQIIARLKPEATPAQAQAELDLVAESLRSRHPDHYPEQSGWRLFLRPLHEQLAGPYRSALLTLLSAVGLLLVISCANVASLMLARSSQRAKEMAVRAALGASRRRLIVQLLSESALLAGIGGLCGLLLAEALLRLQSAAIPNALPRSSQAHVDGLVVAFTVGVVGLTTLLTGLLPALKSASRDFADLDEDGRRSRASGHRRAAGLLIAAEVALAVALSIGAGLLGRSLFVLQRADLGFETENLLTARITLDEDRYPKSAQAADYFERVLDRLNGLPAVISAGAVTVAPLSGENGDLEISVDGYEPPPGVTRFEQLRVVSRDYFTTLGIPLKQGRPFEASDARGANLVAVASESLARKYWGGRDPIGGIVRWGALPFTVVGVVGDIRHEGPAEGVRPTLYLHAAQVPYRGMTIMARTAPAPEKVVADFRSAILSVDARQPIDQIRPMGNYHYDMIEEPRFNSAVLGFFALLALTLSAAGIYGVLSYLVSQRLHEFGVRTALGARRRDIILHVFGFGLKPTAAGLAAGSLAAFFLTRSLQGLLFGVDPTDPATYLAVITALFLVTVAACYLPARRAARIEPLAALRDG